jgi:hypothetical protein
MIPTLAVIVPTILGIGIVFTIATLIRDACLALRGPGWRSRRCGLQGRAVAIGAVGEPVSQAPAEADLEGRRSRKTIALWGSGLVALGIYVALGSLGNYIGLTGWSENVAWLLVALLFTASAFGFVGLGALLVAIFWTSPPAWTAPILARTPLGMTPDRPSVATAVVHHPAHIRRLKRDVPVRLLGPKHVTDDVAFYARAISSVWTVAAIASVSWLTFTGRIPAAPEELEKGIAAPAWFAAYALLILSAAAVYRWELAGSIALAVVASLLGLLSSIQYQSWVALIITGIFAVPAFLHWLAWQRDHHAHHLVRVAVLTALLVMSVFTTANAVHENYFGPTHPLTSVATLPASPVEWAWAGGTTSVSTEVIARIRKEGAHVRLAVSDEPALEQAQWADTLTADTSNARVVRFAIDKLEPDTTYFWALEVDGRLDEVRTGRIRTLPDGPASFTMIAAACARSGSGGAVFDTIRGRDPLVYLMLGDMHYANIGVDDPELFRVALQEVLTSPGQSALYRTTSIAYTWDDHDYSDNDGHSASPSRQAAGEVYRSWVPHHPLVSESTTGPIGQSFVAGRVRVIMTDTRSQRTPPEVASADAQMLGKVQEEWFTEQLAEAREAGQIVIWAGSSPWVGEPVKGDDTWAGYPEARQRMADIIADSDMAGRFVAVAGDAHMVALDDGSNTDYSTLGVGGFPLLQAAALDRPGSVKGGPYSGGVYPGGGQFGEIEVNDDGRDTIDVTLRGLTWDGEVLVEQTFTLTVGGDQAQGGAKVEADRYRTPPAQSGIRLMVESSY